MLARGLFPVKSNQCLNISTSVATLSGTIHIGSALKLVSPGEVESLISNFHLSVTAHTTAKGEDPSTSYNSTLVGCYTILSFLSCLTSQQQASVSQGQICTDKCMCCHTEIEAADHTFYLTQSQYTDTGPTSPSADPITPGAWQGSHWSANF